LERLAGISSGGEEEFDGAGGRVRDRLEAELEAGLIGFQMLPELERHVGA
jgi:hypothetical protein